MRRSRLGFKYAIRQYNQNEGSIRANQYAKSLMNKNMTSFWNYIHKSSNGILASMIVQVKKTLLICGNSFLNSVKGNSCKQVTHDKLLSPTILIKAADVKTNPGPTTTPKKVWICDICHRQYILGSRYR